MGEMYIADICRNWACGAETHDEGTMSTLGSLCLEACPKLCHGDVSAKEQIHREGEADQSLELLKKQKFVG